MRVAGGVTVYACGGRGGDEPDATLIARRRATTTRVWLHVGAHYLHAQCKSFWAHRSPWPRPHGLWSQPHRAHILSALPLPDCGTRRRHNFLPRSTMSQSPIELRPGLADVPVAESGVSFIDGKRARLEYRGIAVETLARESCFEDTAYLLLKGELPSQKQLADFDDELRHPRRIKYHLKDLT